MIVGGLIQALEVVAYVALVGLTVFVNGESWFPEKSILAPMFVLTLLIVSVLVVGLLTLRRPAMMFFEEKKRKEAVELVVYTAGWLVVFLAVAVLVLMMF